MFHLYHRKGMRTMRKNSNKSIRINGEVQKELSNIIRGEIKDPRISSLTGVTDVEVTPDLKLCKAYISVLGDEQAQKDTMEGLKSAEGFIRSRLAKNLNLRNTPELKFILRQSIEYGVNMSKLIDEVTRPLHEREAEGIEETDEIEGIETDEEIDAAKKDEEV